MKRFQFIPFLILLTLNRIAGGQIIGCTDRMALNYNPYAIVNDGSCYYDEVSVIPQLTINLPVTLGETSGVIFWNDRLWTHNDNDDINIYSIDTLSGEIVGSYEMTGALNNDWEEISQDENFIYIGDIGNNTSGNRKDLSILRIPKNSILADSPTIETIGFAYSDQTDFSDAGSNNTDFDCEAFIVTKDSIYLFTKKWKSKETSVYVIPNNPGTHTAEIRETYDVEGLITGAIFLEGKRVLVLSGYSNYLEPFIFLLYDFTGTKFFSGNKRKMTLSLPFHQVEAITTANGLKYFITNENFVQLPLINSPQKLHVIELDSYLNNYLGKPTEIILPGSVPGFLVYPVPAADLITISSTGVQLPSRYYIFNNEGEIVQTGRLSGDNAQVNISRLASGVYIMQLGRDKRNSLKVIKVR